jgi:hypothetical protein
MGDHDYHHHHFLDQVALGAKIKARKHKLV